MSAEHDQDRNESATPHKLAEARRKGQVARSQDVVSVAVLAAAIGFLAVQGWAFMGRLFAVCRQLLAQAPAEVGLAGPGRAEGDALVHLVIGAVTEGTVLLVPPCLVLMAVAVMANAAQTGGVFSLHPLVPDWARLDPAAGWRRVVSSRMLFDAGRTLAKLAVLVVLTAVALFGAVSHLHRLSALPPGGFLPLLLDDAISLAWKLCAGLAAVAAADVVFTRRQHARQLRMSRREVREESRQHEGDPRIRSRLRELRREWLRRSRAVRETRHADLLITNPTHVAVALTYRHGEMSAPRIVAKGTDRVAAAMREAAARHGVPVVQRPALARALHAQAELEASLPEAFYRDIAQLMIWVLAMRRSRGDLNRGPA